MRARFRYRPTIFLAAWLACGSLSGCVIHGHHSLKRVWFDYNTLGAFAFYCDEIDHLPPTLTQVRHYRWMYNDWQHEALLEEFPERRRGRCRSLVLRPRSAAECPPSPPSELSQFVSADPAPAARAPSQTAPDRSESHAPPRPRAPIEAFASPEMRDHAAFRPGMIKPPPPVERRSPADPSPLIAPPPAPSDGASAEIVPAPGPTAFQKAWRAFSLN